MKMALIYDPLNDIDLFAWCPPFDHDIYEMAISFKHPVKITPPTKQRLFREGLGLILLGCGGSPLKLKINGTTRGAQIQPPPDFLTSAKQTESKNQ